jgi:ketosteroid isomerase-like protein
MRAYETTTNAHDLEALLELIADDAIYLFSDRSSHIGKASIGRAIQINFDAIEGETYRIQHLKWLATSEDVAACVYEFDWSGRIEGKPASGAGRGTTVIRRMDGRWKVAHEHLSSGGLG